MDAGNGMGVATERSAVYRTLAASFSYSEAGCEPFAIRGADYNHAFDPSVNPAACSLREGAYAKEDQCALFEELVRFYEFFGLRRSEQAELPDHLAVELEFMHLLTHLEARATGAPEQLASVRRAEHDFLNRHLARLMRGLRKRSDELHADCAALVGTAVEFIEAELELAQGWGHR